MLDTFRENRSELMLRQVFNAFKSMTKKLRQLAKLKLAFEKEQHVTYMNQYWFANLWREAIKNQRLTQKFKAERLKNLAFERFKLGVEWSKWNREIVKVS